MFAGKWHLDRIGDSNCWTVRGVDSAPAQEHARVRLEIPGLPLAIVLKVPGYTFWVGLYATRAYHPAEFDVCRIIEDCGDSLYVETIASFPVRKSTDN